MSDSVTEVQLATLLEHAMKSWDVHHPRSFKPEWYIEAAKVVPRHEVAEIAKEDRGAKMLGIQERLLSAVREIEQMRLLEALGHE